jgi:hypothetical protein
METSSSRQKALNRILRGTLTMQGIADLYNVTRMTVCQWRQDGCPAILIDGYGQNYFRFVPKEVEAWRKSRPRMANE